MNIPVIIFILLSVISFIIIASRNIYNGFALASLGVALISGRLTDSVIPVDAATIFIFLLIISWFVSGYRPNKKEISGYVSLSFCLLLVAGLISVLANKPNPEMLFSILRFCSYFALIFISANLAKDRTKLESLLSFLILTGGITVLIGFYRYMFFPESSIGLEGLEQTVSARIASTYDNPNFYGEYLVLLIPVAIAITLCKGPAIRKLSAALIAFIMTIALFLTYSRGSWMGLFAAMLIFIVFSYRKLFYFFLAISPGLFVVVPGLLDRVISIFKVTEGTAGFRLKLWNLVIKIFSQKPIIGSGIGTYSNAFTEFIFKNPGSSLGWVEYGSHNSFLRIAVEMGVIGVAAFCLLLFFCYQTGFSNIKIVKENNMRLINIAVLSGLIGFTINSLTSNSFFHPRAVFFFWIYAGLLIGISRFQTEKNPSEKLVYSKSYIVNTLFRKLPEISIFK